MMSENVIKTKSNDGKDDGTLIQVLMSVPANLWSQQVLRQKKSLPLNDFEVKVLSALAFSRGLKLSVLSTKIVNSIDVIHSIFLTKL
jgi:hypothetical protein